MSPDPRSTLEGLTSAEYAATCDHPTSTPMDAGPLNEVPSKRLKELERENARLRWIVADQALDLDALREVAKGNF